MRTLGGVNDPQMRASDADRDKYTAVLQDAFAEGRLTREEYDERLEAVYLARTYGDLEPLVADLPAHNLPVPRPSSDIVPASSSGAPLVAVFSEVQRKGPWTLAETSTMVAVFGAVSVDLTKATLESPDVTIQAFAVFGEVKVLVPEGMHVDLHGTGIFGAFERKGDVPDLATTAPRVRIGGLALFGAVTVKTVRSK
jgi:hypothetical protein